MAAEIRSKIEEALKEAIRNRDETAKNALRGLLTAMKNREKELMKELDDQEVVKIVSSQVKMRRESVEQYKQGGRDDLVEKEEAEIRVLEQFLPRPLTDEELERLVEECIEEVKAKTPRDLGKVMKIIMPRVAGRADGKIVNEMVRKKLSG
ncbi:GatB/YqeY domain-containing protein [Thermodesulforhabdus norvegica]|uniref:GatB/YqeY domain-containing protein n=1 Tax=Thermodesulforhabdus norvegica TaxID=39841 RepID=A0A1I4SKL0_9BACT|nr:GatB/YqeY domain-containing protein [Thermodesulforhabdus norvegica]SFM64954.1 hypothetical protein SAMN05660836_01014 [Thermodesulforhabdus norvegica]